MITYENLGKYGRFGNQLFQIASTIGYAVKNNLSYGFSKWEHQKYFKNSLPKLEGEYISLSGYLQDYRNFDHCKELIRHYFDMPKNELMSNLVFIHYRDYEKEGVQSCHPVQTKEYFIKAKRQFKDKKFILFSDNISKAKQLIDAELYHEGDEMQAFKYMISCSGGICSNSSFSWWAGYLGGGKVVLPANWFTGRKKEFDTTGYYFPNSIKI